MYIKQLGLGLYSGISSTWCQIKHSEQSFVVWRNCSVHCRWRGIPAPASTLGSNHWDNKKSAPTDFQMAPWRPCCPHLVPILWSALPLVNKWLMRWWPIMPFYWTWNSIRRDARKTIEHFLPLVAAQGPGPCALRSCADTRLVTSFCLEYLSARICPPCCSEQPGLAPAKCLVRKNVQKRLDYNPWGGIECLPCSSLYWDGRTDSLPVCSWPSGTVRDDSISSLHLMV